MLNIGRHFLYVPLNSSWSEKALHVIAFFCFECRGLLPVGTLNSYYFNTWG